MPEGFREIGQLVNPREETVDKLRPGGCLFLQLLCPVNTFFLRGLVQVQCLDQVSGSQGCLTNSLNEHEQSVWRVFQEPAHVGDNLLGLTSGGTLLNQCGMYQGQCVEQALQNLRSEQRLRSQFLASLFQYPKAGQKVAAVHG